MVVKMSDWRETVVVRVHECVCVRFGILEACECFTALYSNARTSVSYHTYRLTDLFFVIFIDSHLAHSSLPAQLRKFPAFFAMVFDAELCRLLM